MQNELSQVKQLIQQGQYAEARRIIKALDHPKKADWLAQIDALEHKNRAANGTSSTPQVKSNNKIKTSKPLPLLPEEERELLPRGKPSDPQGILTERWQAGPRARVWMMLLGAKSAPLIMNYFRMGRPLLGLSFLVIYILWIVAAIFCFGLVFVLGQQLIQNGTTHIPGLLLCVLILVGLPFSPRIIAWVQQEHYDQWLRNFSDLRRDFLANKG